MDEEMLRPFFCTQSLGPFVHPGAKLKGGCETKGGYKARKAPKAPPGYAYRPDILSYAVFVGAEPFVESRGAKLF